MLDVRSSGVDGNVLFEEHPGAGLEQDGGGTVRGGGAEPEQGGAVRGGLEVHGALEVGLLHAFDVPERIPIHPEGLGLARLEPAIIGLVIRVGPGHQLDVRAVGVGQDLVPHASARAVAPGPEFLAGNDVVVRHAQDARFLAVVVAGEEVLLAIPGEHGIGIEMVGVPTHVHTAREIRAAITGGRNGPGGELVFRVVGHELGAGRIDDLVKVIGMHRHVGKAKHRVDQRRPVENADRALEAGAPGPQGVADRPAHALAQFQFAHPYRLAAVGVGLNAVLDGQESRGAVMVGDVPFNTPRNPRPD